MNLSRRRLMQSSAATLLTAGIWPGRLFADDRETKNFSFIEVNDLHYVDSECGHFFEKVVQQMKATPGGIDMVLIVGDLADNGHAAQQAAQRDIFDTLGVPYHVIPGNHDYLTDDDRSGYDAIFGKFLNYTFDHNGWRFIALDTTQGTKYSDTAIQPATFKWLDENLPKFNKSQPTVVFTHFPMGPHVTYRPKNADDLLERFKPFNVQAIFDGHFHGFSERKVNSVPITTNKCCAFKRWNHDGTPEKGYFLCQAKDGQLTREFIEVKFPGMPPMPPGTHVHKADES